MSYLNYLVEANIGLVFFFGIYWLLLRKETQFRFQRMYLLGTMIASLLFPLISISFDNAPILPSLSQTAAAFLLPEVVVSGSGASVTTVNYWWWINTIYLLGVALFTLLFAARLLSLITVLWSAKKYAWKKFLVAESETGIGTFSFFNFIYLGQSSSLSEEEKQDMLRHEETHALQLHSIDILLVNIMGVAFWFNPIVRAYKNSLVQLHEFEADARSVEGYDVDAYCSLLAKTALQAQGYPLANHFTNSFTLKRILMMKTLRTKIRSWKLAAAMLTVPVFFFVAACQDQVIEDLREVSKNSSMSVNYPQHVKDELDALTKLNPNAEYVVIELNEEGKEKLKTISGADFSYLHMVKSKDSSGRDYVILEKGERLNQLAFITKTDDNVFTVVEDMPQFKGGTEQLFFFLAREIKYPLVAREKGVQGTVFVQFIVNENGTLTNVSVMKGIGHQCDEEAARVVALSPAWEPGKQGGKAVRTRMVLPITFKLDGVASPASQLQGGTIKELTVVGYPKQD